MPPVGPTFSPLPLGVLAPEVESFTASGGEQEVRLGLMLAQK